MSSREQLSLILSLLNARDRKKMAWKETEFSLL